MAMAHRTKRRRIRCLLGLTIAAGVVLLLQPVWFPWVLAPALKRFGLQFASYDRMGWTRFALHDVDGEWTGARLQVQRAESVLPTVWLWRKLRARADADPFLVANGVELTLRRSGPDAESVGSAGDTLDRLSRLGAVLQRFLPVASVTNGIVRFGSNRVSIARADWRSGRLQAWAHGPTLRGDVELMAQATRGSALAIRASWKSPHAAEATLQGEFTRQAEGWRWAGELGWLANRAPITASFTSQGWWPAEAQLDSQRWMIPASLLKLEGYKDPVASLTANVVSNRFSLQASAFAEPADDLARRGFPEARLAFGADGDPHGVTLRALDIQMPWLTASLSNEVTFTWSGDLLSGPALLRISADFGDLPGVPLTGRAEGVVRLEPQGRRSPSAEFRLSGNEVSAGRWAAQSVLLRGRFAPPLLQIDELRAESEDGTVVGASGTFDVETKRIAEGRWRASGGSLQKYLPGVELSAWAASGEVAGPLIRLSHRGVAAVTRGRLAGMKPFDLKFEWSADHLSFTSVAAEWTAGESRLTAAGAVELQAKDRALDARLDRFTLRRGAKDIYRLQRACALTLRAVAPASPSSRWDLVLDPLDLRGDAEGRSIFASARLAGPARGDLTLNLTNVAMAEMADFIEADLSRVRIAELAVAAHWSNGPVYSTISGTGAMTNGAERVYALHGDINTGDVFAIDRLTVSQAYTPTLSVTGTVPFQVMAPDGSGGARIVWDEARSIAVMASWNETRPESVLVPLATQGHLEFVEPDLRLQVAGTRDRPFVHVRAEVKKVAWQSKTNRSPRPSLENVRLRLEAGPDALRLNTFAARLDGQPVAASGEWKLTEGSWREWWSDRKLPDWNDARGRLELGEAQVAAFSIYLPKVLAPEGRVSALVELKTGKQLSGLVSVTNAATRSIGTITPVRDIAATVRLNGGRAELERFRGQIGGQPVRADGFALVTHIDGSGLEYQINLVGSNVPLARSPELLLRGDFDLSFRGASNRPPLVSGEITLRDGLFVQHASELMWSRPRRPEWRPPYFSVTNEPFADWRLDLAVHGDRFLRARTPVFSGVVSADFHLEGPLIAPVISGDARLNSGRLIFPFGTLTVSQGFASFGGNDVRGPDVQLNASGRNYRYDLRLEVKGPADGANVVFSSTPPLASEEILLLLTAGELPQSDFAFSSSARAGRLATFLGKDLLNRYLGSDPSEERLVVRSGESISDNGRLTYSVEYRLSDRWSIIGEYDEFNAFNSDLRWKVLVR